MTVGEAWAFEGAKSLEVIGPDKARLRVTDDGTSKLVAPDRVGVYEIALNDDKLVRVAAPAERKVELSPRRASPQTRAASLGDVRAKLDISPHIAIALLALLVAELVLRAWSRRTAAGQGELRSVPPEPRLNRQDHERRSALSKVRAAR